VLPPDIRPRATEHISDIIQMISQLIDTGHAYVAEQHVLFDVSSYPDYGQLSRRDRREMIAGARVDIAPYKRQPEDFVLWKPSSGDLPGWDNAVTQAFKTLDRLYAILRDHLLPVTASAQAPASILEALYDDLNTPKALAALNQLCRELATATDAATRTQLSADVLAAGNLLGLLPAVRPGNNATLPVQMPSAINWMP
jgi:cysteinyl-tRNA synthetase